MAQFPLISVIIVNYNTSKEVAKLLHSLEQCHYSNWEIIVVDNASPNDSLVQLEQDFDYIKTITSSHNVGFAGGNNLGIDAATGDYLLFLNPDTEVEPDFFEPLLAAFEQDNTLGMVSPKIKYYHQKDTIQYAGYHAMHPITLQSKAIGKKCIDHKQYNHKQHTAYGHGAAMMIRKEIIDTVGKMDEEYFLYYEELDWCQRIQKAGYKICYVGLSTVWHKESVATEKGSPLKVYYLTRNRILFARKHLQNWQFFLACIYLLFCSIPKNIWTNSHSMPHLKAYLRGILWHFKAPSLVLNFGTNLNTGIKSKISKT
jgi:GT2 family glycosyltransferase